MCRGHRQMHRRGQPLRPLPKERKCSFPGCERGHYAKDVCQGHYNQKASGGELKPLGIKRRKGENHINRDGYVIVAGQKDHPNATVRGYILQHVMVMAEKLGRPLLPGENVHHLNGVRDDNRPENLELWVSMQPTGQRPQDLVAWAKEVLLRYEPTALCEQEQHVQSFEDPVRRSAGGHGQSR